MLVKAWREKPAAHVPFARVKSNKFRHFGSNKPLNHFIILEVVFSLLKCLHYRLSNYFARQLWGKCHAKSYALV